MSNTQLPVPAGQPFNIPPHMMQQLMQQFMQMNTAQLHQPHLAVEFYAGTKENPMKSELMGRPIFDMKEYVKIRWAGDNKREHHAFANEKYIRNRQTNQWMTYIETFPLHYEAFKKNAVYVGDGTPVSELTFLSEAQRAELRALNIHTAEALAALDGAPLKMLGSNGRAWQTQAKAYIAKATDMSVLAPIVAENKALREKLEAMKGELDAHIADMASARVVARETPADGVPPEAPKPVELPPEARPGFKPDFAMWQPPELKAFIKDRVGRAPGGTPKHEDLVAMVENLWGQENA